MKGDIQSKMAEMIGTTRSRVSFFMDRFRKLGLIEYNGLGTMGEGFRYLACELADFSSPTGRPPGSALSITHKSSTDDDAQLNVDKAS